MTLNSSGALLEKVLYPLSADVGIIIGIIMFLVVALGIAYKVHQKHVAQAPPKKPYYFQSIAIYSLLKGLCDAMRHLLVPETILLIHSDVNNRSKLSI